MGHTWYSGTNVVDKDGVVHCTSYARDLPKRLVLGCVVNLAFRAEYKTTKRAPNCILCVRMWS